MEPVDVRAMQDLTGKVAVVTGASRGIGSGIAMLLASAGADVAIVARDKAELDKLAAQIGHLGRRALAVPFDLNRTREIPQLAEEIAGHFGRIDILVNNAGINIPKPALDITEEDWDRVLDLNLKSVFFLSQAVGRHMIAAGRGGKIINMSSQMAHVGYYKRAAYCASKGGLLQLTRALAIEWASHRINVNCVAPTFIETPMTKPMFEDEAFLADVLSRIPMGRLGKTEDLYGAVLFLASPASDLVTGQSVIVDGGWTVW